MLRWHDYSGCLVAQPRFYISVECGGGGSLVLPWHDFSGCLVAQPRFYISVGRGGGGSLVLPWHDYSGCLVAQPHFYIGSPCRSKNSTPELFNKFPDSGNRFFQILNRISI